MLTSLANITANKRKLLLIQAHVRSTPTPNTCKSTTPATPHNDANITSTSAFGKLMLILKTSPKKKKKKTTAKI